MNLLFTVLVHAAPGLGIGLACLLIGLFGFRSTKPITKEQCSAWFKTYVHAAKFNSHIETIAAAKEKQP